MDVKESDILGKNINNHWYYKSKAKAVSCILNSIRYTKILDVGAGSAFFSRYLLNSPDATEAWCVDIGHDKDGDELLNDGKILHFRRDVGQLNVDLVLMMDVLEHVDDDVGLLKLYIDKVPIGTKFLISVPAFQFMWSSHDIFLEHRRRYCLSQIENTAHQAGLKILSSNYYFGLVFPIAFVTRMIEKLHKPHEAKSQLKKHNVIVNEILAAVCNLEIPIQKINRMGGLTIFCLTEKINN